MAEKRMTRREALRRLAVGGLGVAGLTVFDRLAAALAAGPPVLHADTTCTNDTEHFFGCSHDYRQACPWDPNSYTCTGGTTWECTAPSPGYTCPPGIDFACDGANALNTATVECWSDNPLGGGNFSCVTDANGNGWYCQTYNYFRCNQTHQSASFNCGDSTGEATDPEFMCKSSAQRVDCVKGVRFFCRHANLPAWADYRCTSVPYNC